MLLILKKGWMAMRICYVKKIVSGVIFFALLASANSAPVYHFKNDTLNPPEGKYTKNTGELLRNWDENGVVRVAVVSDHNFGYELWSGVQLIEIKSEEIYNINAVECYVSFCLYVGKIPPGKYFINHLYAHDYTPSHVMTPISTRSAPIRNSMGSFEVKPGFVTDLGVIGIYQGVESSEENNFFMSFQGYYPEIQILYDELYRGFQKNFTQSDELLGWDDSEWKETALKKAPIERMFFVDFSRRYEAGSRLFFPSVLGMIQSLDLEEGFSHRNVGTFFMLSAFMIDGEQWVAGGEGGRIYISENQGVDWKTIDAFPRDEIVVEVFKRKGLLHALTVSQEQRRAKLYMAAAQGLTFSQISKVRFKLEEKSLGFSAAINHAEESLTEMYFNRRDLKKIKTHVSGNNLIVQFNSEQFSNYNFEKEKWDSLKPEAPVTTFFYAKGAIHMMSEPYKIKASRGNLRKLEQKYGDEISQEEFSNFRMMNIFSYSEDSGKELSSESFSAVPRGGLYVQNDGSKLAVLSLIKNRDHLKELPKPQIYLIGNNSNPVPTRSLDDIGFFYDSDLLPMGDGFLLIDRVAPRVYRFGTGGNVDSYRLYLHAYKQLSRVSKKVEVQI